MPPRWTLWPRCLNSTPPAPIQITAGLDGTIDLTLAGLLSVDGTGGTVTLVAGADILANGEITATESVSLTADDNVTLHSTITTGTSISVTAGADGTGSITGDIYADLIVLGNTDGSTTSDTDSDAITLTAGATSGDITLTQSALSTRPELGTLTGIISLFADGGAITHTDATLTAYGLIARAKDGIAARTRIQSLEAEVTGAGDVDLINKLDIKASALIRTLLWIWNSSR